MPPVRLRASVLAQWSNTPRASGRVSAAACWSGREDEILQAVEARNLSDDPNRYLLDPADHIAIRRNARAAGLAVVGFYHSHPHSAARPSATDQAEAAYPDHLYLIVGVDEVRLFRLADGNFVETPFVTVT